MMFLVYNCHIFGKNTFLLEIYIIEPSYNQIACLRSAILKSVWNQLLTLYIYYWHSIAVSTSIIDFCGKLHLNYYLEGGYNIISSTYGLCYTGALHFFD